MSTAMLSPMPGRCTLTATSSPVSRSTPLYTYTCGTGQVSSEAQHSRQG
jgi:hypothetical protein